MSSTQAVDSRFNALVRQIGERDTYPGDPGIWFLALLEIDEQGMGHTVVYSPLNVGGNYGSFRCLWSQFTSAQQVDDGAESGAVVYRLNADMLRAAARLMEEYVAAHPEHAHDNFKTIIAAAEQLTDERAALLFTLPGIEELAGMMVPYTLRRSDG